MLTRFVFRRNAHKRVLGRLRNYSRKLTKDPFDDIKFLLTGSPVTTIVDVGANIGFVTFQFLRQFPEARVFALEPNPTVFGKLEESFRADRRVKAFNVAAGDKCGTLTFAVNANSGTSSFLQPTFYHKTHQAYRMLDPISVRVVSLDDFAQQEDIQCIDILKLDVEGFELKVLEGAVSLLERQAIKIIYTEVNVVRSYEQQPLFHEITAHLEKRGYHLYNFDDFVAQESSIRQAILGNAVYVSSELRASLEEKHGKVNCGW